MNNIIDIQTGNPRQEINDVYYWKDRHDVQHYIPDMSTGHLFYTVRMIWNHSAPEEARFYPYKRYNFSDYHTPEYICERIPLMLQELARRSNLSEFHTLMVTKMLWYLHEQPNLLVVDN